MSQATGKAPQVERQKPKPAPLLQQRKTGAVEWLRTWSQVVVAEVLKATERRRSD